MFEENRGDLTIAQVALLKRVHKNTVRKWINEGTLQAYRVGARTVRVRLSDLEAATVAYKAGAEGLWAQLAK